MQRHRVQSGGAVRCPHVPGGCHRTTPPRTVPCPDCCPRHPRRRPPSRPGEESQVRIHCAQDGCNLRSFRLGVSRWMEHRSLTVLSASLKAVGLCRPRLVPGGALFQPHCCDLRHDPEMERGGCRGVPSPFSVNGDGPFFLQESYVFVNSFSHEYFFYIKSSLFLRVIDISTSF